MLRTDPRGRHRVADLLSVRSLLALVQAGFGAVVLRYAGPEAEAGVEDADRLMRTAPHHPRGEGQP